MLKGERIGLGPLVPDDVGALFAWCNDVDAARFDLAYRPMDWMTFQRWLETVLKDQTNVLFAIRRVETKPIIGFVFLGSINGVHRSAELGIRIGAEQDRGQGLGTAALRLGADYAWNHLNLNRLWLTTFAYNERALRAYERVGFQREGVQRRAAFINGKWTDVVMMGALRPEGEAPAP